ncbi:MAG: hypothetical protein IT529_07550 [Burkholderiales bacterium]|nr:hypothetical protein [Burkholderiales bacterium]
MGEGDDRPVHVAESRYEKHPARQRHGESAGYAGDPGGPYGFYYWNLLTKRRSHGQADIYKHDVNMSDEAVTVEYLLDRLVIRGSVANVVDQVLAFRETVGDFGTLLYAGHDWADPALARRSMELMAEKVMPAVNAAIRREPRAA